jgi:hypothetical protein
MTLPEYYLYLQQLPLEQARQMRKVITRKEVPPTSYKKKLIRKSFLPKRKP